MSFLRKWSSWVVLLGAGLAPPTGAACLAADVPQAQPQEAPAARAAPAPAAQAPRRAFAGRVQAGGGVIFLNNANVGGVVILNGANDPNIRNLESQFLPQFQQLLYAELAFLRRTCNADAKPFAEIAKTARRGLRPTVREYALSQNAMMRQRFQANRPDAVDPRAQVQRLLDPLVKAELGPEQARRYREECDKRAASRKRAAVLSLVAAVDERLVLSAEQRTQLLQSLSSNYQNAWDQWLQMYAFNNPQSLPSIGDELIIPLLTERQKGVWRQLPKQDVRAFWGIQFVRPGMFGEAAEVQEIARIVGEVSDDQ
jgi:hypothetical protein